MKKRIIALVKITSQILDLYFYQRKKIYFSYKMPICVKSFVGALKKFELP